MPRIKFSMWMGMVVLCIAITVIAGWCFHIASLVTLFHDKNIMPFNTALALFLASLTLVIPDNRVSLQAKLHIFSGIAIILIAGISLSENLLHYSAGIDNFFLTEWISDNREFPGRMAGVTSLALLLIGFSLLSFSYAQKKFVAISIQVFICTVTLLGLSALLGYLAKLPVLNSWYLHTGMSLYTAFCIFFMGLGLWSFWRRHPNYELLYAGKEESQIIFLSGTVFICIVGLATLIGFSVLTFEEDVTSLPNLLEQILPIVFFAIIVGMFLLYWQVIPLVRKLFRSAKQLQTVNLSLLESETRFRTAFDSAAIGMSLVSISDRCLKVNTSLCQILGYSEKELLNMPLSQIIHPEDVNKDLPYVQKLLTGEIKTYQSEQRYFHKSGQIIWIMTSMSLVRDSMGDPLYYILQLQNISAEKKAEDQLRYMAYHDALTGLANRNKLEQCLNQLLLTSPRSAKNFAVIFLDLDHFKNINDTIGHSAGDILLQVVADRLKSTVRSSDLVARLGGDEFVLVITEINSAETIAAIAQKILDALLKTITIKGHELYITTSIGISLYPNDGTDLQTLMKNADLALYRAKEYGRNNYQFCTPAMTEKAQQKMIRQNALSHALANDEFVLHYQPKIDLSNHRITGVEALLRWKNNDYGMVSPEEIISLAEETGLIIPLSEWVLRAACKQGKLWHSAGLSPLTVSVNLSPRQFKQANIIETILQILKDTHFPIQNIELEITESLIMQDPENTLRILHTLKEFGAQISIDDFGTGYISLSYLRRFSIDKIKIDKTFIQQIIVDEMSSATVTAIIAMANKLGIKTIAEGVETFEQYEFLLSENCSELQGYFVSRPLTAEAMTRYLKEHMGKFVPQRLKE